MKKYLAALTLTLIASNAFAHSLHIEEPQVTAGKLEVHNIASGSFDDHDAFSNELEIMYGFNDWFLAKLAHNMGDHEGEKYDWYSGGEVALQFELLQEGEIRPATALYTAYSWHPQSDHPQNLQVMGIFGKKIANFNNAINLSLSHDVGENSEGGVNFDAAARSVYEFNHHYGVGLEYFGNYGQFDDMEDFDRQGHVLGPVITFSPFQSFHMHGSLAYLFGISEDAADGTLKLELGFEL